jgi:hypothetical protein
VTGPRSAEQYPELGEADHAEAGLFDTLEMVDHDLELAAELYAVALADRAVAQVLLEQRPRGTVLPAPERVAAPYPDAPAVPPGLTRREEAAHYYLESVPAVLAASNRLVARTLESRRDRKDREELELRATYARAIAGRAA